MATKNLTSKPRRSKAEIESEFEQIREDLVREKQERTSKDDEMAQLRENEIRELTQNITAESLVQKIGTLELEVGRALSGLSSQLLAETKLLQSIREAVALERKELERLHKMDVAKSALDQFVKEYSETKEKLEQEIAEVRGQWAQEKQKAEEDEEVIETEKKLGRQREKEEFEYERALERKKEQDVYEEARRVQERQNKEKQETLEKSWAARETGLKEQEVELARLRQDTAAFPDRLKKEVDKAVAEATKTLQVEHKQAFTLMQKDMEAERRISDLRTKSFEETAARQLEEIKSLTARLEEAKKQVQDIAVKAIEGASGAKALTHVSQIAMEQAKPRSPQS